jgi:hypothetical protein
MGKLLLVNTNRIYGWWGVMMCAGAILGGIYGAVVGAYAALGLTVVGAAAIKICLRMATQRTEVYECGFSSTSMFGKVSARYADLKSISRTSVTRNGVVNTMLFFGTQNGERVQIVTEKLLKQDERIQDVLERACGALAETWEKRLDKQKEIDWIVNGSQAVLKIRKEGVLVEGNPVGLIPLDQFQIQSKGWLFAVCKGEQKVTTVNAASANYYTGLMLIENLRKANSKAMFANTNH